MAYALKMTESPFTFLLNRLPELTRANLMLRVFAWKNIRLIRYIRPRVLEIDDSHCLVKVPLDRRTRNHLQSQYIGSLMIGADLAGGLLAFRKAAQLGRGISFAFKDAHAEFHKRAEGDTHFLCSDGEIINEALQRAFTSDVRINQPVQIRVTVPSVLGSELVASFVMTLSIKARQESA